MAVAMTGAVMNRARCVVPSHTIYPVARPCAVRTHHSQSHKAARLPSRLLRPAFNTAAAERAVLGLWPSIRPVTCIDSELGSTLTVRRAHRELLAAACIDINVVRKVIVTPHCAGTRCRPPRPHQARRRLPQRLRFSRRLRALRPGRKLGVYCSVCSDRCLWVILTYESSALFHGGG